MAKSKKKSKAARDKRKEELVSDWEEYFGSGDLSDWQRLMADLGFTEEFTSKSQCRKALTHVWVNIRDFLDDNRAGREIHRFDNETQLSQYTINTGKIFPKKKVPKESPLRKLLAHIFSPGGRHPK
ncbi:hypothetical protein F4818DRAFT_158578 [Hypoxylon cercidicola]|nr:hypothetical protein F4818DRAFT_158578 [Hypoxylon cercidicola]